MSYPKDHALYAQVAADPSDEHLRNALAYEVINKLRQEMPPLTGVCGHGEQAYRYDTLVYHRATGAMCYSDSFSADPDSPKRAKYLALIEEIRP